MKKLKPHTSQYIRHSIITIDEGIDLMKQLLSTNQDDSSIDKGVLKYNDIILTKFSSRYCVFLNSLQCVSCGMKGIFFAIEKDKAVTANIYHLNLYSVNSLSEEILFTKDHIIPRSKGGKDILSNYQTMCKTCNHNKGNIC
jgi:5-methylcytosine-specific restriction endonuclease McrA